MVRTGGMVSWVDLTEYAVFYFGIIPRIPNVRDTTAVVEDCPFSGHGTDREVA